MSTNFGTNPSTVDPEAVRRHQLEIVGKACASWFLWLAGLSMVNSVLASSGAGLRFIFGLGITQLVDGLANEAGSTSMLLTLFISACIAGIFVVFWYFGKQGHKWAFLVGMGLYVIDGLILLPAGLFLDAAFHLWVLYRLYQGYMILSRFLAAQQIQAAATGGPILPQ